VIRADWLEPYLQRWRKLQPRERVAVSVAAGFVLLFMLYALVWLPVTRDLAHLREAVPAEQRRLALMQVQSAQVKRLRASSTPAASAGNLLATVEQAAVARGLRQQMTKMEPDSGNGVRLTFDQVGFNAVLSLLADLQKQHGLRVENASVEALADNPGTVNARLLIRGVTR